MSGKGMTIRECAGWLPAHDNYMLLTHRRPDGDTLGSAAALVHALRGIGKTAHILANPEATPRYLPFVEKLFAPPEFSPDTVVAVDTASLQMLPDSAEAYASRIDLAIDHHPSHERYAEHLLVDGARASCGEIVFDIIKEFGPVGEAAAAALYVAVATDTGCFSFENTDAPAMRAAAELIELGAPSGTLNRLLFRSKTRGRIAVEGMVYSGMEFLYDDRAVIVIITQAMMESANAVEDDMENIAAFPLSVAGVEVGATIRELPDGGCKVSVRSSPGVNASDICARFGGGGHAAAAGFSHTGTPDEVRQKLLPVLKEFLDA